MHKIIILLIVPISAGAQVLDRACPCDQMSAQISADFIEKPKPDCLDLIVEYGAEDLTFQELAADLHRISHRDGCDIEFGHLPTQTDKIPSISFDRRRRSIAEILSIALSRTDLIYCTSGQYTTYVLIIKR